MYIYGSIGYSIFKNCNNKNIIIFSDKHDDLKKCDNKKPIKISTWLKNKINSSKILLEEIDRKNNLNLEELFPLAEHTKELKELYLQNNDKIVPIDIRLLLIPFNIILYNDINIKLYKYIEIINMFFSLKSTLIKLKCYNYDYLNNSKLGYHFIYIKKEYYNFIIKYKKYLNNNIYDLNINELNNDINILLDSIMEWYICANLFEYDNYSIIIHIGLFHAEKIIYFLNNLYKCFYEKKYGINKIIEINKDNEDCVYISSEHNLLF